MEQFHFLNLLALTDCAKSCYCFSEMVYVLHVVKEDQRRQQYSRRRSLLVNYLVSAPSRC
jgi:hypothetical protein